MFRYLNSIGIQIKFVSTKKPTTSTAAPHTAEFYKWAFLLQAQYWYMNGLCKVHTETLIPNVKTNWRSMKHCSREWFSALLHYISLRSGLKIWSKKKSNYKSYSWAPTTRDDCTLRQIRYVRCFLYEYQILELVRNSTAKFIHYGTMQF